MDAILSTLGLNWAGFLWHLANFIVLLVLLRLVLYKPVLGMLEQRARRVRESMERAEEVRRQSEQADADRQALLAETRTQAQEIRARADADAKRILAEADARAQEQANRILVQAQNSIETSRQQMMADVRSQVADLVITAVDRVTRNALDAGSQRALVQQFLAPPDGANGPSRVARGGG